MDGPKASLNILKNRTKKYNSAVQSKEKIESQSVFKRTHPPRGFKFPPIHKFDSLP